LIDGSTEDHFWEGEYKSNWISTEIFSMQSAVTEDVARNMNAMITESEKESIRSVPTVNKEAYKLYLQAEYRFGQLSLKGISDSQSLYSHAMALDSTFIEPYIGLATSHLLTGLVWGMTSEKEAWSKAKPIYLKALEIDRTNSGTQQEWIKTGFLQGMFLYEWDIASYEIAYVNSPDRTSIYIPFSGSNNGDYARKSGRFEDVLEIANKTIDTNPTAVEGYVGKACALYFLGRKNEAMALLAENDDLNSENYFYLMETAKYYHYLGANEKSKRQLELFKKQFSDRPPIILWLIAIHAEMEGTSPEVQRALKDLQDLYNRKTSGSPAWFLALYYCHIKDVDRTFEWLQKSYDHHEVEMTWLKEEPVLRPLHDDPRYLELYDKVGFSKINL
jgi:tetratricopeptide (TPR) repeat protein